MTEIEALQAVARAAKALSDAMVDYWHGTSRIPGLWDAPGEQVDAMRQALARLRESRRNSATAGGWR